MALAVFELVSVVETWNIERTVTRIDFYESGTDSQLGTSHDRILEIFGPGF